MNQIQMLISGVRDDQARSALYYLGRYVKQAEYFEEYGKDIFEDEERSAPTEQTKALTLKLIAAIEEREGMAARHLERPSMIRILNEITDIEEALGPQTTTEEEERARSFISKIEHPSLTNRFLE